MKFKNIVFALLICLKLTFTNTDESEVTELVISEEIVEDISAEREKLKEEEREVEELKKELEKEISEIKDAQNGNSKTTSGPITIKEKKKNPTLFVVNPIRRIGTNYAVANQAPCGNIPKDLADTLTNMGSKINMIWEIREAVGLGNCTVAISSGMDVNFTNLKPIGNNIDFDEDYSFSCGRQEGFEFQQFELPDDYACDKCTLQLTWNTPYGDFYSCSDIMILGNKVENCLAKCLNSGACVNGRCICPKRYGGEFCETDLTIDNSWVWWILVFLLLAAGGIGGYLLFKKNQDASWVAPQMNDQPLEKNFIEKDEPKPIQIN